MAGLSNYLENALVNAMLRGVAFTSPSSVYVSLHTADPTDAGTGTEVSGTNYARVAVSTSGWSAPSNGATTNSSDVSFPMAGGSWGTITHVGIWDASSAGNLLFHGVLAASRTINSGEVFQFTAGNLQVALL